MSRISLSALFAAASLLVLSSCSDRGALSGLDAPAPSPTASTANIPLSIAPALPTTPVTQPATQGLAQLTVLVTDLRNHKGQLIFGVFTSAAGFPSEPGKSVNWQIKDADADTVTFTTSLPPGVYGASVLHDENRNKKMDKNLAGIPQEGYGVTNNPKPKFRAATFQESTFTLPSEGATKTISLQYF